MDDTEPITLEGDAAPARRRTGRWTLTVVGGPRIGTIHTMKATEVVLGRGSEPDLDLDGEGISRLHAKIVTDRDGRATIIDLGSMNGSYVNGLRVVAEPLRDNDRLELGRSVALVFRYEYGPSDEEARSRGGQTESIDGVYETIAATLDNLARMYEGKGELAQAVQTYRRSLSLHADKLGADDAKVAALRERIDTLQARLERGD